MKKTIKQPISFNPKEQKELNETAKLYEIGDISLGYGVIPKTVKLSITYARELPVLIEKFIPDIEIEKLEHLFSSIKKLKEEKYKLKKIKELKNGVSSIT